MQADNTIVVDLNVVLRRLTGCRTADVEGAHRQLCARLTNRLGCHNTNSLTHVYLMPATQITAVAGRADAVTRLTSNRRAHDDFLDAHLVDLRRQDFIEHGARLKQNFTRARIDHVFRHNTAENTLGQRLDNIATINDRSHHKAFIGSAILLGHNDVLGHIDQTTRQVTGVSRLQRRISQAFARAVGRNKVLQYVQPLAEVRRDRRLDD